MPKKVGKVLKLFISQSSRSELQSLAIDENGIVGDKFYAKDIQRSILLTSTDSYKLAQDHGIDVADGLLGENVLMDFNPYTLPHGTRLRIGDAWFEITQNCTLCNHLSAIDSKLPKLLRHNRGIFAKALHSATIYIEDEIFIES
ncbi:MAG: MOSC domain-containing protein [Sulfuricurvum sp.]